MEKIKNTFLEHKTPLMFVLPAVIFFTLFKIFPILNLFWLSIHQVDKDIGDFIGFKNYLKLIHDQVFWLSLKNTTIIVILVVFFGTIFGYLAALLLTEDFKGQKLFRILIFIPVVTTVSIIAVVWKMMYYPANSGMLNSLLAYFNIPAQQWLADPKLALYALTVPLIWRIIGYNMMIFIAALKGVDKNQLEAAQVEGANWWQKLIYIIIPATKYAINMVLILAVLRTYKVFVPAYVMTSGDPQHKTETIATWIYKQSFRYWDMSYGAALAVVLFLIIMVLTIFQKKFQSE
ncbi:carbohydrate ABC transporter permease [Halanaerobium salsuginis]|uniref:Carbohydrate ABC transporter membrane protein 1, CUT1 family n=1 Tax=Halanaerobium salsuginis TaxID=29563 RepID=A0A1I4IQ76_9FIRM|nr:sugar ABC transporter permease [Halanaerobium salsuginis]SFL56133.1 carbohydrate ABC transporter membrane protein 1, CUT1 family [Halanaerobium salsuginis]